MESQAQNAEFRINPENFQDGYFLYYIVSEQIALYLYLMYAKFCQ